MRWEDERYVRLYTRNTVEWEMLPWESRCLWPLILRAVDRAGLLDLGKHGAKGLAALVKVPADFAETGLKGLLDDGCAELRGTVIVIPNFIEAQEATQSDAQRKRESRERARALANSEPVTNRDHESQNVTDGHENGQKVTNGHNLSQAVTSGHSVPSLPVLISIAPHEARAVFDLKSIADRYPRRKGIAPGLAKLKSVVKTQADYDAVLAGMERFVAEVRRKGTEIEYLPYFSTWVNAKRWEDGDDLPLPSVPSESRRDSEDLGEMAKRLGLE